MTRSWATSDSIPVNIMSKYYQQRTGAGLIITDRTSTPPNDPEGFFI